MIQKLKNWYNRLHDSTKAGIRTAWQAALAQISVIGIALFLEASSWLENDLADVVTDLAVAGKAMYGVLIAFVAGLFSAFMNRGSNGATYPTNEE